MTAAPCAGQWELFDSRDPQDHKRARQLCRTCPMIAACRDALDGAKTLAHGRAGDYGPEGTWAGELVGQVDHTARLHVEEQMFDEATARSAHAAYMRGERTDRAVIGHRVYNRRVKRQRFEKEAAA